ncbi:hypothetical protein V8G54_019234, partial [Vigna mungo]
RTRSPARRRAAKPVFLPLQKAVQRGTERRGHVAASEHSSAMRTRPLRISRTRWSVERGSSRRSKGLAESRSCCTQNHTCPRRFPKMVPITMDFEGRGGTAEVAVEEEVDDAGEEGRFLVCRWWSEKGTVGCCLEEKKHGRKNRRRVSMAMVVGGGEKEVILKCVFLEERVFGLWKVELKGRIM